MSDLIYNFAQSSHPGRLTQLGQMGAQAYNQFQAKKAEQERTAQYNSLLNQFKASHDPEILLQMQNVYPEKFTGFQQAWGAMNQLEKEQQVQTFGETYALIKNGQMDLAANRLEELAQAHETKGEYVSANKYREMLQHFDAGRGGVVGTQLAALLGMDDVGRGFLSAQESLRAGEREDTELISNLISRGNNLEFGSDAHKQWSMELGYRIGGDLGRDIVELGNIATATPEGQADLLKTVNERFFKRSEPYRVVRTANMNVQDAVQTAMDTQGGDAGTYKDPETGEEIALDGGIADLTAINAFMRIIDDATVRESDLANIANTAGMKNALSRMWNQVMSGEKLTDPQRQQISEMSTNLLGNAEDYVDTQVYPSLYAMVGNPEIGSNVYTSGFGEYIPKDQRGAEGVMFQGDLDKPRQTAPEAPQSALEKARQAIRAEWPNDTTNNTLGKRIEDMTIEELKQAYPKTYEKLFGGSAVAPMNLQPTTTEDGWEEY